MFNFLLVTIGRLIHLRRKYLFHFLLINTDSGEVDMHTNTKPGTESVIIEIITARYQSTGRL